MRRSPVQSSRVEASNHTLFWVDFITITSGSRFSVHTTPFAAVHESGIGPELTSRDVRDVVAIESKADVTWTLAQICRDAQRRSQLNYVLGCGP